MIKPKINQVWKDKNSNPSDPFLILLEKKLNSKCWLAMDLSTQKEELMDYDTIIRDFAYVRDVG